MLDNVIKGLQILQEYYHKPNGYHVGADHDVIYAYATGRPVDESDFNKLHLLGWIQDTAELDTFDSYDPDKGWRIYI